MPINNLLKFFSFILIVLGMKNFRTLLILTSIATTSLLSNATFAKIGETRFSFEERLMSKSNGNAYIYESKEDRFREAMELPYVNLFLAMPRTAFQKFYYKRADGAPSTNSDTIQQHDLFGWEFHVCYNDDVSVMEFYRRHGDSMTIEELETLMQKIADAKKTTWKKVPYVPVTRRWDIEFKNGEMKLADKNQAANKSLRDILPASPNRFIYIELPEDVASSTKYQQSLQFQIMEIYQRNAYEAYRRLVERQSSKSAAKTARSNARNSKKISGNIPPKINMGNFYEMRDFETLLQPAGIGSANENASIVRYKMKDVLVGGSAKQNRTKNVQITYYLPLQPETMLGYDYELADGSIRAKIYRNGVLFVDTAFDKSMRATFENTYKQQARQRKEQAVDSVGKF